MKISLKYKAIILKRNDGSITETWYYLNEIPGRIKNWYLGNFFIKSKKRMTDWDKFFAHPYVQKVVDNAVKNCDKIIAERGG